MNNVPVGIRDRDSSVPRRNLNRQWLLCNPHALILITLAVLILAGSLSAATGQQYAIQVVHPGESIQAAIDRAQTGGTVLVLPGIYRETADATNGLNVTKGISLIGLSTRTRRVVLENAGGQRNGIVVVPADRTACLNCHADLAPPFDVLPGVARGLKMRDPLITGFSIRGITIQGFVNNGLFTENLDGFVIDDVESIDNANYGIFPTLSRNGIIRRSRATGSTDSGVWVETSENVRVTETIVEGNVIGFEVSNSDDIVLDSNEIRHNTVGVGVLLLPHLFDDRPGAKRITISNNFIHHNNRPNAAPTGSLVGLLPPGTGVLHMGADDSLIIGNRIENNDLAGIAVLDMCIAWAGTTRDCRVNPRVTPAFLADQAATNNMIMNNDVHGNGENAPPSSFAFAASDLALLSLGPGNCFRNNRFGTSFSLLGFLPNCR